MNASPERAEPGLFVFVDKVLRFALPSSGLGSGFRLGVGLNPNSTPRPKPNPYRQATPQGVHVAPVPARHHPCAPRRAPTLRRLPLGSGYNSPSPYPYIPNPNPNRNPHPNHNHNPNPNPTLTLTKAAAATARAAEAELRVAQLTMRCMDLAGSPCASSSPHVQRCTDLDGSPH